MGKPKTILNNPKLTHHILKSWSSTKKIVFATILGVFAAILQSAGGILPGVGFAISPFSTVMILISTIISLEYGFLAYLLSIFLLILIEPSELFIFPFTTGLLGLGIGWGLYKFNKQWVIVLLNGIILLIGICIPLYGLKFGVFGPMISSEFQIKSLLIILGFTFLYSWLWLKLSLYFLYRINIILSQEK